LNGHAIQRLLFDLDVASQARAENVQDRVSLLCRASLFSVIETCLADHAPSGVVVAFDRIVLDLGPVREERMEEELTEKVRQALRAFLAAYKVPGGEGGLSEGGEVVPVVLHRLRLLETFLQRGAFPWSADATASDPDALLVASIEEQPEAVRQRVRMLGRRARVRQRLAHQFAASTLQRLVGLLDPAHQDLIVAYVQDLQDVQRQAVLVPGREFSETLWEAVLAYLLVEQGRLFDPRAFVRYLLGRIAGRYRRAYGDLLDVWTRRVQSQGQPAASRYRLPSILLSLREEDLTGLHPSMPRAVPSLVAASRQGVYSDLDVLAFFLRYGTWPPWAEPPPAGMAEDWLLGLLAEAPASMVTLLKTQGRQASVRRRLVETWEASVLAQLIERIEPREAPFILASITRIQEALLHGEGVRGEDRSRVPQVVWESALTLLLGESGSAFGDHPFVRGLLRLVAMRYGVSAEVLLAAGAGADPVGATAASRRLVAVLEALRASSTTGLGALVASPEEAASPEETDAGDWERTEADRVRQHLLYGVLPGALPADARYARGDWLGRIDEALLREILYEIGPRAGVVKRIVARWPPAAFRRLIALLAPAEAASILGYLRSVQLARKKGGVIREQASVFRRQLRAYTLAYLLRDRDARVSVPALIEATLKAVAARYKTAYERVLAAWGAGLADAELAAVYRHLEQAAARHPLPGFYAGPVVEPAFAATYAEADVIRYYVQFGSIPAWGRVPSQALLRAVLLRLVEPMTEEALQAWIREQGQGSAFGNRLLRLVPETLRSRVQRALRAVRRQEEASQIVVSAVDKAAEESEVVDSAVGTVTSESEVVVSEADAEAREGDAGSAEGNAVASAVDAVASEEAGVLLEAGSDASEAEGPAPASETDGEAATDADAAPPTRILDEASTAVGRADLLVYFLRHGVVPWWGRSLAQQGFGAWFAARLDEAADPWLPALQAVAERPEAVERLVRYLPEETLARLLVIVTPAYAGFVRTYLLAGEALSRLDSLTAARRLVVRPLQWQVVLARLLDRHAPAFRIGDFLADVGRRWAARLGLRYDDLLGAMTTVARAAAATEVRFVPLVEALAAEQASAVSGDVATEDPVTAAAEAMPTGKRVEVPTALGRGEAVPSASSDSEAQDAASAASGEARAGGAEGADAEEATGAPAPFEPAPRETGPAALDLEPASTEADTLHLARYFLQYGVFPPEAPVQDGEALEAALLDAMQQEPERFRRWLLPALQDSYLRQRMADAFSQPLFQAVLRLLIPEAAATVFGYLSELHPLLDSVLTSIASETWMARSREGMLRGVLEQAAQAFDSYRYVKDLLVGLAQAEQETYAHLVRRLQAEAERREGAPTTGLQHLLDRLERDAVAEAPVTEAPIPEALSSEASIREALTAEAPVSGGLPYRAAEAPDAVPEGEPFYVSNAGMVLLWPFLFRYFDQLEMLAEGVFRDEETAHRAVHLMQYLVSGQTDAPEYHLMLNKVLCGVHTAQPLVRRIAVTEAERALSESLLYGVTQNWPKLKNTSIEGLREAFLQREGRLLRKPDRWLLQVEARAYDMLLDYLPWTISTIRLAWMENPLFVTWR